MGSTVSRPGPCVKLVKSGLLGVTSTDTTWFIPITKDVTLTAQQITQKPIEKFFEGLKDAMSSADTGIGGGTGAAIVQTTDLISDLLGFKLGKKLYYSQSWAGSKPSSFSLSLDFFRGMNNQWNAQKEVYNPIITLMKATVPQGQKGTSNVLMSSPMPSSLDVFASYTTGVISGALSTVSGAAAGVTKIIQSITGLDTTATGAAIVKAAQDISNKQSSFISTGTWSLEFGWNPSTGQDAFIPFLVLKNCIILSSIMRFNPVVEISTKESKTVAYPISGSIDLTFETQMILTSDDLDK